MTEFYIVTAVTAVCWFFGSFLPTLAYDTKTAKETMRKMTSFCAIWYALYMTAVLPAAVGCFYRWEENVFFQVVGGFILLDAALSRTTVPLTMYALRETARGSWKMMKGIGGTTGSTIGKKLKAVRQKLAELCTTGIDASLDAIISWYLPPAKTKEERSNVI